MSGCKGDWRNLQSQVYFFYKDVCKELYPRHKEIFIRTNVPDTIGVEVSISVMERNSSICKKAVRGEEMCFEGERGLVGRSLWRAVLWNERKKKV